MIVASVVATLLAVAACVHHAWKVTENQRSAGSSQHIDDATTVQQCLDWCVANVDCVGVDVDQSRDPLSCRPHFSRAEMQQNARNFTGTDQYQLIERCSGPTVTAVPPSDGKYCYSTASDIAAALAVFVRYDTRCYINVRSKANMSQLNLPHATDN